MISIYSDVLLQNVGLNILHGHEWLRGGHFVEVASEGSFVLLDSVCRVTLFLVVGLHP